MLECTNLQQIFERSRLSRQLRDYHWQQYCFFAHERSLCQKQISQSLNQASKPLKGVKWCRMVAYQYSNKPLSSVGSQIDPAGGRFNFGNINKTKFPVFSSLYIAKSATTAKKEALVCKKNLKHDENISFATGSKVSYSMVYVDFALESIIDTTKARSLQPFVNVIKNIKVSSELKKKAQNLRSAQKATSITQVSQLRQALQDKKWRQYPMALEVPAPCQIFGHMVYSAGLQGILYRSHWDKKTCLAVFPENFKNTKSYIKLSDKAAKGVIVQLDSKTCAQLM